jgi:hypothetical protein
MNKNAGKTISAKPKPSVSAETCSNQEGIDVNDQRSFTNDH